MRTLLAALFTVAGCSSSPSSSPDLGGAGGDLAMAPTCMSDGQPVALAKRYGVRATLDVNIKVPSDCSADSCIFDKDAISSLLLLADMSQSNGTMVAVSARACQIKIPPIALKGQPMPTQLTASDQLVQSVKPVSSMATLSGATTCANFSSGALAILLGTRLASPATDPLPIYNQSGNPMVKLCGGMPQVTCDAATDSACICDQESDGKLGATVGASGLPVDDIDQVYLALRTVVALDGVVFPMAQGQVNPGQRILGQVKNLKLEQSPVGCHQSPTGGGAPHDCDAATVNSIAKLNPLVTQSVNGPSTFIAVPVPDGESCAQLVADAPSLFK